MTQQTEWRPIATAPKDGSYILFGRKRDDWEWSSAPVCVGFWHDGQDTPGWRAAVSEFVILEEHWPYWQHLPAPPPADGEAVEKT